MAITNTSLKNKIETELVAKGFVLTGEHSRISELAEVFANAVVDEITSNAEVVVTGGSSDGTYQVK